MNFFKKMEIFFFFNWKKIFKKIANFFSSTTIKVIICFSKTGKKRIGISPFYSVFKICVIYCIIWSWIFLHATNSAVLLTVWLCQMLIKVPPTFFTASIKLNISCNTCKGAKAFEFMKEPSIRVMGKRGWAVAGAVVKS